METIREQALMFFQKVSKHPEGFGSPSAMKTILYPAFRYRGMCSLLGILSLLVVLGPGLASAARISEDRKNATHVLTAKVVEVDRGNDRRITVRLSVTGVEKGEGLAPGQTIEIQIYGPPPKTPAEINNGEFKKLPEEKQQEILAEYLDSVLTFAGHKSPPAKDREVRVYIKRDKNNGERWEGIYPDWFDLLEKSEK